MSYQLLENELLFARKTQEAKIPSKRDEDGCMDIYPCFEEEFMVIQPHTNKLISTGIYTAFQKKYRLAVRERGSNTKANLIVMAGQIDSGFRGEIFVSLYNGNDIPVEITKMVDTVEYTDDFIRIPYSKAIGQIAVEEVPNMVISEVDYEDLVSIISERGNGSLGSSNK